MLLGRGGRRPDAYEVARREADAPALPGRELEHRPRSPAGRDPPGPEVLRDAEDAPFPVEEGCVDREAHEPHVNRGSGAKEDAFAPLEPGTSEEASEPCERCLREETPLTHQAAVVSFQGDDQ